ncbi:MAG TPA: sigma-70 family RNA polymerase sigma factor [Planctomycetota bacterium]
MESVLPWNDFREERRRDRLGSGNHQPLESTARLISLAKAGDPAARAAMLVQYREPLARFLHGRLAPSARGSLDTDDLVQDTLMAALERLPTFEYRGLGSFWAYLRKAGVNLIVAEARKRRLENLKLNDSNDAPAAPCRSPSSEIVRVEANEAYENALEELPEQQRNAFLLRHELALRYEVIAGECGYPSADAARMAIARATMRLAKKLADFEE